MFEKVTVLAILCMLLMAFLTDSSVASLFEKKGDLIIIGGDKGCPPKLIFKTGGHGEDLLLMPTCYRHKHYPRTKIVKHIHIQAHKPYGGRRVSHHHHYHPHFERDHKYYHDEEQHQENVPPMEIYDAETEVDMKPEKTEEKKKSMKKLSEDADDDSDSFSLEDDNDVQAEKSPLKKQIK